MTDFAALTPATQAYYAQKFRESLMDSLAAPPPATTTVDPTKDRIMWEVLNSPFYIDPKHR